jgi:hypothetical protein
MAAAWFSWLNEVMRIKTPIHWPEAKAGEPIVIRLQPHKPVAPQWLNIPAQKLIASIPERRTA